MDSSRYPELGYTPCENGFAAAIPGDFNDSLGIDSPLIDEAITLKHVIFQSMNGIFSIVHVSIWSIWIERPNLYRDDAHELTMKYLAQGMERLAEKLVGARDQLKKVHGETLNKDHRCTPSMKGYEKEKTFIVSRLR